ncbi:MAG: hypothetical protein OSJ24_04505 [Muribaculaceae bacterium]|nr:hypothetical protein [Muribaculaceae bacterium]
MNFGFHIFGNPDGRFSQWPDDETSEQNSAAAARLDDKSRRTLTIHREGTVVSYVYAERLAADTFVGFRLTLASMQISRPVELMALLGQVVDMMLTRGRFLRYTDSGLPTYAVPSFGVCKDEIENIRSFIDYHLGAFVSHYGCESLKGYPDDRTLKQALLTDGDNAIMALTYQHVTVEVIDRSLSSRSQLADSIAALSKNLASLRTKVSKLADENTRLHRQKKQYKAVLIMMALLMAAAGGLYSLRSNLVSARHELADAAERIHSDSIQILTLNDSLYGTRRELKNTQQELEVAEKSVASYKVRAKGLHECYYLPSWRSTNYHRVNSVSDRIYPVYGYPGDVLEFRYYTDGESADRFQYRFTGPGTSKSGSYGGRSQSGRIILPIEQQGYYTLRVLYKKDHSVDIGADYAEVSDIKVIRGDVKAFNEAGTSASDAK